MSSDEDLALAAREGDDRAFAALAGRWHDFCSYLARRYCTRWYPLDDLYQEAMIAVWKSARQWEAGRGRFGAYAGSAARNNVLMYIRNQSSPNALMNQRAGEIVDWSSLDRRTPEAQVLAMLEAADLIDALSPSRRQIVLLTAQGYSVDDIAVILDKTPKTVSTTLATARDLARKQAGVAVPKASTRVLHDRTNHGTRSCYNRGCRCPECFTAQQTYNARRRAA